jgi:hypothetical protein
MLSEKAQGGVTSIGGIGGAAYNDAVSIASGFGLSNEVANAAGRTAAGLVAQGMDPQTAVTLAANYAANADRSQMPDGMPAPGGQAQGLPGLSRNPFDMTAPVAPQAAQTFGLVSQTKALLWQRFWWNFWSCRRRVWFLWESSCGLKRRLTQRQPASLQWPRWSINEH